MSSKKAGLAALFAYGFRPFFLLAGIYAVVALAAWLWLLGGHMSWQAPLPPSQWHGHEMMFGFVMAAIAGFMLTAIPSWTGTRGFGGKPLLLLTVLWVAGRLAFLFAGNLPVWLLAVAELLFLPALMVVIAPPLLREIKPNSAMLLILLAFWVADVMFVVALHTANPALASAALLLALNLTLLLITMIGGRIVPAFTANALRRRGAEPTLRKSSILERICLLGMLAVILVDLAQPGTRWAGALALFIGLAQGLRLAGWNGHRSLSEPIVWVMHLAYVWLPLGLILKGVALFWGPAWSGFWLHALGAGAAAMMILAVMARASLGHTGRPLKVAPVMSVAFLLVSLGALLRVFGLAWLPVAYGQLLSISGLLWVSGFVIFSLVYAPILARPRADGKPG